MQDHERLILQIKQLTKKIAKQEKLIKKYKQLAKMVQEAETWEFHIYDQIPDDTWIALDQEDYEEMMKVLSQLDEMQPWKKTLEKRKGRV